MPQKEIHEGVPPTKKRNRPHYKKLYLALTKENADLKERLDITEEYCRDFGIHWNEEKQKYENEDDDDDDDE